jgi:hypothetical protein
LAARLTGWRLDITSEADADETRARYLAERDERMQVIAPELDGEEPAVDGATDAADVAAGIDPELIRKLEEFRRQMFDPAGRAGDAEPSEPADPEASSE